MVMKKKIIFFCYIAVTVLLILPSISVISISTGERVVMHTITSMKNKGEQESLESPLFTGYLLFQVLTFTPGVGIRPYAGANITVKGLFFTYSGQTDESGDCLFKVHTNLIRMKKYFIKVSIPPGDWLHTKRISLLLEPREIYYKDFLFIVL